MFYTGVVESRSDPLELGRCQVRIVGLHTHDKTQLPTQQLPWATPVQPIGSAAMNGIGYTPQQLLVLSDDVITGDIVYGGEDKDEKYIHKCSFNCKLSNCKKIVAAYPHIEGTLPISKETIQAWIDAGTPGEGREIGRAHV